MSQNLKQALAQQKEQSQQSVSQISGLLGIPLDGDRRVEVPNRNAYVYVRLRNNTSEVIQAFNNQVSPSYNLPVLVERQGNRYIVVSVDTQRYENNWASFSPFLPRHGNTHSFDSESGGGGDVVWVHSQQFMPLLAFPSGSSGGPNVIIAPYTLKNQDGTWRHIGNTGTQNLTFYNPSSSTGAIMALVYVDTTTGNPGVIFGTGTVFSNVLTGTSQIYPYIPASNNPNWIPDVAIRLITGTSVITWDNMYDVRQWLHATPTGTVGGGLSSVSVQDEGVLKGNVTTFNFMGSAVDVTVSGSVARVFITGSAGTPSTGTFAGDPNRVVLTDASGLLTTEPWLKWNDADESVEFGADAANKTTDSGKIIYNKSEDFLDIYGAGTGTPRRIRFREDVYVDNSLFANGGQQLVPANQVTNGDGHDHVGGDGATLDHTNFSSVGTNTHTQVDAHIASGSHVQNGNSHDHLGGDGGTVAYTSLTGALTQAAGTYTPLVTGTANVTSVSVPSSFMYMRIGNMVVGSGRIITALSGGGDANIRFTLPIASNLVDTDDVHGNATNINVANQGSVSADGANNEAVLNLDVSVGTGSNGWRIVFMYEII